ncbi:MAG: metal-dependent transcriptional regulator [Clostridiaceae bacterium]|jgi:Mn-dependent DtxR family transcriptional regulator|nr:metal-dependent transcriptional regulator [Clostridiaceae bacterium]
MPIHKSGEDYLETIYVLSKRHAGIHAIDIANEFNYAKPSITKALKILKANGFIVIDEDTKHIILTEKGLERAEEIFDRHQTLTKFWILNGVDPESAAADACRMEHDISPATFACVKAIVQKSDEFRE